MNTLEMDPALVQSEAVRAAEQIVADAEFAEIVRGQTTADSAAITGQQAEVQSVFRGNDNRFADINTRAFSRGLREFTASDVSSYMAGTTTERELLADVTRFNAVGAAALADTIAWMQYQEVVRMNILSAEKDEDSTED